MTFSSNLIWALLILHTTAPCIGKHINLYVHELSLPIIQIFNDMHFSRSYRSMQGSKLSGF